MWHATFTLDTFDAAAELRGSTNDRVKPFGFCTISMFGDSDLVRRGRVKDITQRRS